MDQQLFEWELASRIPASRGDNRSFYKGGHPSVGEACPRLVRIRALDHALRTVTRPRFRPGTQNRRSLRPQIQHQWLFAWSIMGVCTLMDVKHPVRPANMPPTVPSSIGDCLTFFYAQAPSNVFAPSYDYQDLLEFSTVTKCQNINRRCEEHFRVHKIVPVIMKDNCISERVEPSDSDGENIWISDAVIFVHLPR